MMAEQLDDFLEHYGIPGMKWGKRKGSSDSSEASPRQQKKALKQLGKDQKAYDKNVNKNWHKAYNETAELARTKLIPAINKKYDKYDFSNIDNDPKMKKVFDKYINEYDESFNKALKTKVSDMFGERPE
jgi:hypothetical protein